MDFYGQQIQNFVHICEPRMEIGKESESQNLNEEKNQTQSNSHLRCRYSQKSHQIIIFIVDYCHCFDRRLCSNFRLASHSSAHSSLWLATNEMLHTIFASVFLACGHRCRRFASPYSLSAQNWPLYSVSLCISTDNHFKIQKSNDDYQIIDLFDGLCSVILSNNINERMGQTDTMHIYMCT